MSIQRLNSLIENLEYIGGFLHASRWAKGGLFDGGAYRPAQFRTGRAHVERFAFRCKHTICQSEGVYDQNGQSAEMRLHPELVEEFSRLESCCVMDPEPVFESIPRIEQFCRDLIKASIAPADAGGRKAEGQAG